MRRYLHIENKAVACAIIVLVILGVLLAVFLRMLDTVSSVDPTLVATQPAIVEKLNSDGSVAATYYAARFQSPDSPDGWVDSCPTDRWNLTLSAGALKFETIAGEFVTVEYPWMIVWEPLSDSDARRLSLIK